MNKQGQTRLSTYYEWLPMTERVALEAEIIRKCLSRSEFQVRAPRVRARHRAARAGGDARARPARSVRSSSTAATR